MWSCLVSFGHILSYRKLESDGERVGRQTFLKNGYHMVYLFLIGLFIGILIVNLGHETWIGNGSLLGTDMINRLKNSRPVGEGLIGYIVRHRLLAVCLLSLSATTLIGMPVLCLYICYTGLAAGCLLSVAVIRYGIRGLLFMAAALFPQALLLVPAYIVFFSWAVDLNSTLYAPRTQLEGYERYSRQFYAKKSVQIIAIVIVVIMGSLLESYVNPGILHFILKIF